MKDTHYIGLWCWFQAYLPSSAADERENAGDGSQSHCCSCDASTAILDSGSSVTFALRILVSGVDIYISLFVSPFCKSSKWSMQNCVKYCTPEERTAVFEELRPHCLSLAKDKYAHHIVIKMLDSGECFFFE